MEALKFWINSSEDENQTHEGAHVHSYLSLCHPPAPRIGCPPLPFQLSTGTEPCTRQFPAVPHDWCRLPEGSRAPLLHPGVSTHPEATTMNPDPAWEQGYPSHVMGYTATKSPCRITPSGECERTLCPQQLGKEEILLPMERLCMSVCMHTQPLPAVFWWQATA